MPKDIAERLFVSNDAVWKQRLTRKRFIPRELNVETVERGVILPARHFEKIFQGGVCDQDLNFVAGYSRGPNDKTFAVVDGAYPVDADEIAELDEDVIYGGALIGHFGHFMAECLNRMWYVLARPELKSKIAFITTTHGGWHSWMDDFFELMGIERSRLMYIKQPTRFRSIAVPDQSQYSPRSFTSEFLMPYQAIKARIQPSAPKKLYLTRREYEDDKNIGVHCYNEKYFEDFFVSRGFEAVALETLPIKEQIALIMGADELVATIGTLTHWALFCKPEAKFIMLNRTDYSALSLQCLINEATGIDYYVVDASKNFMYANWNVGVCMLGSNRNWARFVSAYFGEHIEYDDDAAYFDAALDKYIDFWCKKYSRSKYLPSSLRNMCTRIVGLEKRLGLGRPMLYCSVHIAKKGWLPSASESKVNGLIDEALDIQALKIYFEPKYYDVYYAVWYPKSGWTAEVSTGQPAGTTGRSKPIHGIKIRLDEEGAAKYDILYRVHDFEGRLSPWMRNGEELYSKDSRLNALQIKLMSKNAPTTPPPMAES